MNNQIINQDNFQSDDFNTLSNVNLGQRPKIINEKSKYTEIIPEFSKQELNAVTINKQIAKEIKMEKYKVAFTLFVAFIVTTISGFFLAVFYSDQGEGNFISMKSDLVPSPVLTIMGIIIALIVSLYAVINLRHISIDVKRYKSDLIMGKERIPFFILKNYKKIIKNHIFVNWLAFSIYLYGGLTTLVLFLVNKIEKVNLDTTIMIFISVLIVTAIIHIFSLIFNYTRKGNLDSYYGYEIIPLDQQVNLKKAANKVCMIFFFTVLAIVLFVIFIPMFILRKRSGKKLFWFL